MYHYKECRLDDVCLINGYSVREIDGGEIFFIDDVEQLHQTLAIARRITRSPLESGRASILGPCDPCTPAPLLWLLERDRSEPRKACPRRHLFLDALFQCGRLLVRVDGA
jgi:hypothetical protein